MSASTRTLSALKAAGASDSGLERPVNEDRYHVDLSRGIFIVVDGVGGQAAGGRAADIALETLKSALARPTGAIERRMRGAITVANNDIYRAAARRSEWSGMACVLTAVVVEDDRAVIGHVGDTRLYKLRAGGIEKVTRDHSPVGEREDQAEISEAEAMRHPRRHEVYRDVGSERHTPSDEDFVDVCEIPFEPDAALLLCSDGLTDLVESSVLNQVALELAGRPSDVVNRLVDLANEAGGKDNVTIVYLEGEQFAERSRQLAASRSEITRRRATVAEAPDAAKDPATEDKRPRPSGHVVIASALMFLGCATLVVTYPYWSVYLRGAVTLPPAANPTIVVRPNESIASALQRAAPGSQVLVDPGEYRDQLVLRSDVHVISRVPRAATLRLPGGAADSDPAVVAERVSGAALIGFRIVGDVATPLGTGVLVSNAEVSVMDVEISGAANVAVDVRGGSLVNLVGSSIQDNPGAALALRSGSSPRIAHNLFAQNGSSDRIESPMLIDEGVDARFTGNVFNGSIGHVFASLSDAARAGLLKDNWFIGVADPRPAAPPPARGGRGR
jgi:serine/threonine protein phosphatase PrpC